MRDYKLTLNLIVNDTVQSKIFKQYDTGNEIELELYENEILQADSKINLSTETVLAFFQLANGTVIQKNATIRNGNILINTTADVLSIEGLLLLECVIINGTKKTTTQTLQFTVLKSIDRNGAVEKLPTWDIIDALLDAGKSEQDRLKNETTRVASESVRVNNESVRVANEENRKTKHTQMQEQWQSVSKAVKESNVGQTVVTEVITARTNKQAKTYNNLGERLDTIEDKVQSRDYTEIETNGASAISLPNAVDGQGKIEIQGNTLVNLIDYKKISTQYYSYDKGIITIDKTTDDRGWNTIIPLAGLKPNVVYSLILFKLDDNFLNFQVGYNGEWQINCEQQVTIFTISNISKGFVFKAFSKQNTQAKIKFMLLEGDYSNKNIDYFEGIKSINKIEVLTHGKNRFDKSTVTSGYYVDYTSGLLKTNAIYSASDFIRVKPSTAYILSGENEQFALYDINKTYISGKLEARPLIITPSNAYYIRLSIVNPNINQIQLEEGSTATAYKPYREDKTEILFNPPLRKGDIYCCGVRTNRSKELVLDGGENWGRAGSSFENSAINSVFSTRLNDVDIRTSPICNKFAAGVIEIKPYDSKIIMVSELNGGTGLYVRVLNSETGILSNDTEGQKFQKFRAWLKTQYDKGNPITILCQLAEPYQEQLPQPLTLSSFENGTMFINSNIPCNVKYAYPTNLSSAVASLRDYTEVLETQLVGVWETSLSLADRELRMKAIQLLTTETTADMKNKINEILNVWR